MSAVNGCGIFSPVKIMNECKLWYPEYDIEEEEKKIYIKLKFFLSCCPPQMNLTGEKWGKQN